MMTMKRTAWIGAFLFCLGMGCGDGSVASDTLAVTGSGVAGEQLALPDGDGAGARDRAGRVAPSEMERLKAILGLSDEQVAQIQPILDATRSTLEIIRGQVKAGTLSEADARAQVKAAHDAQNAQILALLTAEQQAKFTAMRDHHCGPFDITKLADALGLSADQVTQIKSVMSDTQSKVNDIHAQVEAGTLTREEAHAQIDQIMKDSRAAIDAVLTADQLAALQKIMGERGPGGPGRPAGRR